MKNPERVVELLAELRELAESDFERHRIDVLERDLHEPPQVEIIDDTHQKFDGVVYSKKRDRHYMKAGFMHRAVYEYYRGDIPEGYEIHHIDGNPANNDIENLQCLSHAEHTSLHLLTAPSRQYICKHCGKKKEYVPVAVKNSL